MTASPESLGAHPDKQESYERGERVRESRFELFVIESDDPRVELAEKVEQEVFEEFFNNSRELMEQEYGPYREASKFLIVFDHEAEEGPTPVGVVRIIQNSEAGFKSLKDIHGEPWNKPVDQLLQENELDLNPNETWDIATLAVRKNYRKKDAGYLIGLALEHACYRESVRNNIKNWVAIIDDEVLKIGEVFGQPFNKYRGVESGSYLDSPASTPVYAHIDQIEERAKQAGEWAYESLILGSNMNGLVDFPEGY